MPNKLADQSSPYLRQHKDNPVDWYPWGEEAFRAARARGVPILVSIGYSTCHWCHVMAHESFEDPGIANLLNENFVCIKVDREERPDIDAVYMQATQMLGYQGGWPLNVFLTPDGLPFFGGTYWPPVPRQDMPSFPQVLVNIRDLWQRDRARVIRGGQDVAAHVIRNAGLSADPSPITFQLLQQCMRALYDKFDKVHGGFGGAPKFPQASVLDFLLRYYNRTADVAALSMVELTLGAMAEGGIHDQLGGGFSRYSVDAEWHVPHFEKMLYDNALLLPLFVDTWRYTGDAIYESAADGIASWLKREMVLPGGGFAAALDADSEGVEGKYYIWTAAEIDAAFDAEDADLAKLHFGISDPGTFEGASVLRIVRTDEDLAEDLNLPLAEVQARLESIRQRMLQIRSNRVAPGRDDKVIASWNGLAIHALATAGDALDKPDWIEMALGAATFLTTNMMDADGKLARSWADGRISAPGVLEDYANVARGMVSLYGVLGDRRWLDTAWTLTQYVLDHFTVDGGVCFYDAASPDLFTQPRDLTDSATPSGNAAMAEVLLMMGVMRRDDALTTKAQEIIESVAAIMPRYISHFGMMATAAERLVRPPREVITTGGDGTRFVGALRERVDPLLLRGYVPTEGDQDGWAFLADKPVGVEPTAFWCTDFSCKPPVTTGEALREVMAER